MSDIKVSSAYPPAGVTTTNQTTTTTTATATPVTPHHQIRSTSSTGVSLHSLSDRSPADIKRKLEQRLADTKTKMYNIGRLGESLVKQEQELNDRIKEIDSHPHEDEIRPELRSKLADLENGFKEVERESAKAFTKSMPFLGKENMGVPRTPSDSPTKSEFVGHGTVSPSKNSTRKARNATPRQHDIEFAADIGQGLLDEVRKLQALLAQRDQKLGEATASISRSDRQLELFDRKIKQMHEDQESLKEENWNMHLRSQELQNQLAATTAEASKFSAENSRLVAQNTTLTSAIESLKLKNTELSAGLTESKSKHENEMSTLRRSHSGLHRDRSDLQRHVDELKIELSKRPETQADDFDETFDLHDIPETEESVTPNKLTPSNSPQLSPIKNTPSRNAPLELETTKSSLHHAHRMVTNLRNNLHREKTEKVELKRLLAAAQDDVEQLRNKASGSKRASKRPPPRRPMADMLGNNRKARNEISIQDNQLLDVSWNDEGSSSASPAYVTAQEYESDSAFVTATEHEMDETDTDYRTGMESQPNSEDDADLTETESGSVHRMPSLGTIREFSPSIAFTSDEDDSPARPALTLKHRRSQLRSENGRRVASSSFDPPPQPLFQELMEGGGSSIVNSPGSVLDSPNSVNTAVPFFETPEIEMMDVACQCDPIPDPEPVIVQLPPVIVYKEPEKPSCTETATQSDSIPDPEPIVIQSPPIIIYKEREPPMSTDVSTQSDPIPDPEPIVIQSPPITVYKDRELPMSTDVSTQSDPIPDPEPIIVQAPPVTVYKERERPLCAEVGIQSFPIPPPEPIIIQTDPVVIREEVIVPQYVEREKPASTETGTQCDPIPPPEPIIIRPDPIIIHAEPIIVTKYIERERPLSTEIAVQSDPLPPPTQIIVYREHAKPTVLEMAVQSDPVPEPEPIYLQSDPIIIYRDIERPLSAEMGVQAEHEVVPTVVYVERPRPTSNEMGTQFEEFMQESKPQSDVSTLPVPESSDKEIQTLLTIPMLETYQFPRQSLSTSPRPKTPITIVPPPPTAPLSILRRERSVETDTPKTMKTLSSITDGESTPKSPLKEITNTRRSQAGSPSRPRYMDSPSTFSSRVGTSRRYGTILEYPTLRGTPQSGTSRSRMSQHNSPSRMEQRRLEAASPTHSTRMGMSVASRSTTAMSRRTSISSFESEVEGRFGLNRERLEDFDEEGQYATGTDPRVIQAITQTMIGEHLWKYTRNQMQRSKISENRHRRFFWIHPYTKTLYWSAENPAISKESNRSTRSAPIKKITVVTDDNPYPPGLYRKSIMCHTESRAIKVTAQTKQSHETWLQALNHLLDRGPMLAETEAEDPATAETADYAVDMREFGAIGTRRGTTRLASMSTTATESDREVQHYSSFGKLSSMFRGDRGDRGTMSTIKGKSPARSIYEASMITDESHHSHEHIHDIDEDGLENVRACCGGKHDVGTLARKGKHSHK